MPTKQLSWYGQSEFKIVTPGGKTLFRGGIEKARRENRATRNERWSDNHSLSFGREKIEAIEISAVEEEGENGYFGKWRFFG